MERYFIDEEVIEFIAEKVDTNIREMEGLLSKVHFFAAILGKKTATLEEAREAFKEQLDVQKQKITPEKIIECVCSYFGVAYSEVVGKKKTKEIVEPRMIAIYLIYDILGSPLNSIAKLFGKKDHTTIIYSRDKITDQMKTDQKTKLIVGEIKKQIN
jgi:chromosomal replication initiator protein